MQVGQNRLIVGLCGIVRDAIEGIAQAGETIRLADGIGVVFSAESQRDLQAWQDAPFILSIEARGSTRAIGSVGRVAKACS